MPERGYTAFLKHVGTVEWERKAAQKPARVLVLQRSEKQRRAGRGKKVIKPILVLSKGRGVGMTRLHLTLILFLPPAD